MVKWLILLSTLLFAACASSNPVVFSKTGKVVYFPECIDPTGTNVKWIGVAAKTLIKFDARAAVALRTTTGQVQVLYNKEGFPYLPDEWIQFIIYHECSHHQLGHLLDDYKGTPISDEWTADCIAAKKLKENNVPFARLHIQSRIYLKSKSDTHGDIEDRIGNMRECYNADVAQ